MLRQPGIRLGLSRPKMIFLEPSAGRGAFLVQILADKLAYADRRACSKAIRRRYYFTALGSIYGIELEPDNVRVSRQKMMQVFLDASQGIYLSSADIRKASRIIKTHIRQGDTLAKPKGRITKMAKPKNKIIIGNPPYSKKDTDANASSSSPIFQKFVQKAIDDQPIMISFIISNSWFKGGKKSVTNMRNIMLKTHHIRRMEIYNDAKQIFPNTHIRGGVSYFLWDRNFDNTKKRIRITIHDDHAKAYTYNRKGPLGRNGISVFIERHINLDILHRVRSVSKKSLRAYVSNSRPFTIRPSFNRSKYFHVTPEHIDRDYKCYGNSRNPVGYVSKDYMKARFDKKTNPNVFNSLINDYEVIVNRSNNIGIQGTKDDNIKAKCIRPGEICTETFVVIGSGLGLDEHSVHNLRRYLRTKFARYMMTLHKNRSDASRNVYTFVPLQDFNEPQKADRNKKFIIDWHQSEDAIDRQLFQKYSLTIKEQDRIESTIEPDHGKGF